MARKLVTLVFCTMVLALAVEAYQGKQATAAAAHGLEVACMELVTVPECIIFL
jgi:hypothetical protein